jgi:hypothetical protein
LVRNGEVATTTMNISLPETLREFVESEVSAHGYTSAMPQQSSAYTDEASGGASTRPKR